MSIMSLIRSMNCVAFLCDQVQTAALDEMFHRGETSVERYHKALLLMEGLSLIITEIADQNNINKCKYDTHRLPFKWLLKIQLFCHMNKF